MLIPAVETSSTGDAVGRAQSCVPVAVDSLTWRMLNFRAAGSSRGPFQPGCVVEEPFVSMCLPQCVSLCLTMQRSFSDGAALLSEWQESDRVCHYWVLCK